jgi:hypothetical protein
MHPVLAPWMRQVRHAGHKGLNSEGALAKSSFLPEYMLTLVIFSNIFTKNTKNQFSN